jgi:uncharacterized protein involved in response to NO
LVTLGALLRVATSLDALDYRMGMDVAGLCWIGSFLLFIGCYGPILSAPRIGERE